MKGTSPLKNHEIRKIVERFDATFTVRNHDQPTVLKIPTFLSIQEELSFCW